MPRKKPKKPKKPKKKDMALAVSFLGNDITLGESITGFSTGALDPDKYKQGSNAVGWYGAKNGRQSIVYTLPTSQSWSTGDHLWSWQNSDVASKMEAQTTGTTTASGVTLRVTLANGAYREWHLAGSDTWDGGWRNFVIDLGHTGSQLYASSGTFSSASNISSVTIYYDLSNSGNIRNVPANCWVDAIRVGTGLQVHNTSAADPAFDYGDIADVDEAVANMWGILQRLDPGAANGYGLQGELVLGDSASTNHLDLLSTGETVTFLQRDGGDGYGFVADALYDMRVEGNSTGTDQDFYLGVKVGTGDSMTGRNGTKIEAGGPNVVFSVDLSDSNIHNVGLYGASIVGATGGVTTTAAPTTLFELGGAVFDGCDQVDFLDAVARQLIVLNTAAVSTSGAIKYVNGTTDIKNSLFINNVRAIYIATLTGDVTFDGMEFQGNTFDVEYGGTGDYDLNWSNAPAAPTVNDASTGTLTPVNTVNTTIKGVPTSAEWRLYEADATQGIIGSTELDGAESHTGGDITYADAYSTDTSAALQVMATGYEEFLRYFILGAAPQTITVVLTPETNT